MPDTTLTADGLVAVFAENVRARRKALHLSQAELAERLECHVPYVSELERGRRTPWLPNLAKLAVALRCTPAFLLRPRKTPSKTS